jgi:hypothetical protein
MRVELIIVSIALIGTNIALFCIIIFKWVDYDRFWERYIPILILVFRNFIVVVFTGLLPLIDTFSKSTFLLPYPLNMECISSIEMVLLNPTATEFFFDYLENYCESSGTKIFELYADIWNYQRICRGDFTLSGFEESNPTC